ncbi:hypothetical protein [Pedobacter foliorum]|uniref:hypothetical protein n=1 Tax=Pedobacter foliorum TaxID=2739058 RepID=UPI001565D023|nr:hypothetical protein [Pedobacter foliorum]NRF40569.1 hypothetical protein [Pedobacter foliorum]
MKKPLYIINTGNAMLSPLKAIYPDQISSIEVIKNKAAIQLHGEKAKDGVVIITIKEQDLDKVLKKLKEDHMIE